MTVFLRSNKGTSHIELELEAAAEYAHELVYESTIRIKVTDHLSESSKK